MLKSEYLAGSQSKNNSQAETSNDLDESYGLNSSSKMSSLTTDNYNFGSPQVSEASNSNDKQKAGVAYSAPSLKGVFDSPDNSNCSSVEESSDKDNELAETKTPDDKHCHEVSQADKDDENDDDGHHEHNQDSGSGGGASEVDGHNTHNAGSGHGGHGGHGGGANEGSSSGGHGMHGNSGSGAGGGHDMHGASGGEASGHAGHGDYTEEMYSIMDSLEAYGIPVKQIVKDAFREGKEATGGGSMSGGAGSEGREVREKMDNAVKAGAEEIMKQISAKIDGILANEPPSSQDKEFLDTVAKWMNLGLHSEANNEAGSGTHALENAEGEGGLAFQMAHFMNAGNDTYLGQKLRNNEGGMPSLTGDDLLNMVKEFKQSGSQFGQNGFFGMFQSEGKTSGGDDSAIEVGEFSSYWGASGNASSDVGAGKGAVQNSVSGYEASQGL